MRTTIVALVSLLLLIPVCMHAAKSEYRFSDGECTNGTSSWWQVSEYNSGRLIQVWGVDCAGHYYWKSALTRIVAADPTAGETATYTGSGDNGTPWFSVEHRNAEHELVWAGGRDAEGRYWEYGERAVTGLE